MNQMGCNVTHVLCIVLRMKNKEDSMRCVMLALGLVYSHDQRSHDVSKWSLQCRKCYSYSLRLMIKSTPKGSVNMTRFSAHNQERS